MLQFYFLSVFFNLLTGFILVNSQKHITDFPLQEDKTFRLVLGILTAVTGFIKIFVVVNSKAVIVGDFVPALTGIAGGITLFIQDQNQNYPEWFQKIFVANKYIVGIVCLCAAAVHFVFPGALFI